MAEEKDRRSGFDRGAPQYKGPLFESRRSDPAAEPDWTLAVDAGETASEIILRADVSGVREDDIHINFENGLLTISGNRNAPPSSIEWQKLERPRGTFSRSFILPKTVEAETIKATYRDGILEVRIAKPVDLAPKHIRVGFADRPYASDTTVARQIQRNVDARTALFDEFGRVKASEVPALDRERVFSVNADGEEWVPRFEIDDGGKPLPVIARVLSYLGGVRTPWELALWFTSANGWLDGSRPVDLLTTHPEGVIEAAKHEAEQRVF